MDNNIKSKEFLQNGIQFLARHEYREAINEFKAASLLDADNVEILYNLGVAYSRVGLYRSTNEVLQQILDMPHTSVFVLDVKKLYAFSFIELGKYSEAMKSLDEVINVSNYDISARAMKGYCYEQAGESDKAIATYRLILDIDRHNLNAINSLSYLLALNGNVDEALKHSEKLIEAKTQCAAYFDTLGFIHMKKGNLQQAKKYLTKAFSIDSFSEDIKQHLEELKKLK